MLSSPMGQKLTIWVLTEAGLTGTENQCLGVAEALAARTDAAITVKRIGLKWPYRLWSPFLSWGENIDMLSSGSDKLTPPYPDILIAAGRKAIGPARFIRRVSHGRTFTCILQHPRVNFADFDLVAMPRHDAKQACRPGAGRDLETRGPDRSLSSDRAQRGSGGRDDTLGSNLLLTHGAPNRLTPTLLSAAREKWAATLSPLPNPRIAVLIGGNSRTHRLGSHQMDQIIARLKQVQNEKQAGLMITISRRTPKDLVERLMNAFKDVVPAEAGTSRRHAASAGMTTIIYTGQGDNPYHGFLAFADYIICTNDSTSMLSDAATTGKPIDIIPLPGRSKRHDKFMHHLESLGVTGHNGGYSPWDDAGMVANEILNRLEKRNVQAS